MKELPILFNAPMVRAILDGRKTQTRRTVAHEHLAEADIFSKAADERGRWEFGIAGEGGVFAHGDFLRCPYGEPGDRLWVREAFMPPDCVGCNAGLESLGGCICRSRKHVRYRATSEHADKTGWTPSIFMPRWASRITLEVAEVRVQRLQEISEDDARAEGMSPSIMHPGIWHNPLPEDDRSEDYVASARDAFGLLWQHINGKRAPWSSNPWVWAITFRRVDR